MTAHSKRRPRRIPLTPEEVAHIIQLKKRKAHIELVQLKKSTNYKLQSIFNMCCFFIYWELILCFFGPCNYQVHYAEQVSPKLGFKYDVSGKPIIAELQIRDVNGFEYVFIVNDFIETPSNFTKFYIGQDFLLHKNLNGKLENSNQSYRLFSASPILLLSILVLVVSSMVFINNLNHNAHSLMALTVLNCLTISGIFAFN